MDAKRLILILTSLSMLFIGFSGSAHADTPLITCNSAGQVLQSQQNPPKYTCSAVIYPNNTPLIAHDFLTAYNSSTGNFSVAQPACGDLSDSGTACAAVAPANTTATAHQFLTAYTASTGLYSKLQPGCSDLSDSSSGCSTTLGTLATLNSINNSNWSGAALSIGNGGTGQTTASAAFNALSPLTTSGDILYGGVSGAGTRLAANATATNKYLQSVSGGTPIWVQVAFSDLSGSATAAQLPTATAAAKGIVQGDGSTLTISAGVISCTTATTSQIGCLKPDGTTITISGGIISAVSGGSGTVTTTGTPANGNLTKFSGATSITNSDLSGDCTTSGTLATTCTKTGGVSFGTAATVNTGTSGATIPLNNGNNTFSGNDIHSGSVAITGTTTPTQAAGTLGLAGTATAPTPGANSEGDIFLTAAGGLNLIGQGSTNDFTLLNKGGSSVCTVATGTTNYNCTGLQVGGAAVLTGNQSITLSSDVTGSGTTAITTTIANNAVTNAKAAQAGANTMKGNWTAGTANEADNAMPGCSDSGGNHLNYVAGTGITCGTSDSHAGTVTNVTFTGDGVIDSSTPSSAVTTSGTVTATIINQNANLVLAGPASGSAAAPTWRVPVVNDEPKLTRAAQTVVGMNIGGL